MIAKRKKYLVVVTPPLPFPIYLFPNESGGLNYLKVYTLKPQATKIYRFKAKCIHFIINGRQII